MSLDADSSWIALALSDIGFPGLYPVRGGANDLTLEPSDSTTLPSQVKMWSLPPGWYHSQATSRKGVKIPSGSC